MWCGLMRWFLFEEREIGTHRNVGLGWRSLSHYCECLIDIAIECRIVCVASCNRSINLAWRVVKLRCHCETLDFARKNVWLWLGASGSVLLTQECFWLNAFGSVILTQCFWLMSACESVILAEECL